MAVRHSGDSESVTSVGNTLLHPSGSSPGSVARTMGRPHAHSFAVIAQLVERHHGKVEVLGPIPSDGSV